jgi:citrate synthase
MSEGTLYVTDSRTSSKYEIPIHRNTIPASSFKSIKAPKDRGLAVDQVENGLRLFDPGLKNTAVSESKITFMLVFSRTYNGNYTC